MAAPVAVFTSACAWVLQSASAVSDKFSRVEQFFRDMADRLRNLSQLDGQLEKIGNLRVLKERIMLLFTSSLVVCELTIDSPKHRFSESTSTAPW